MHYRLQTQVRPLWVFVVKVVTQGYDMSYLSNDLYKYSLFCFILQISYYGGDSIYYLY